MKKKILLVHNDYGKYSGEEAVVDHMFDMLGLLGYDVCQLRMSTAGKRESFKGKIQGFISGVYCPSGVRAMADILDKEKPDLVNVHNLYPFISPAALRECKKRNIPVIMTIHNFRLICPTGLFMRNGAPCERCLTKGNEFGCIKYNCEHSIMKSLGYAARNMVSRLKRHYIDCVDIFACITEFQRTKLIEAGYNPYKIVVIPNGLSLDTRVENTHTGEYVGYCGRLSREKGIDLIIEVARNNPDIKFKLAGECREPELIKDLPSNIELLGYISGDALNDFYKNARFMVMASRWYEGFPMSILESAKYSKATIGPNHGGFTEIIGSDDNRIGKLFTPGDLKDLESCIVDLWSNPQLALTLGDKAYKRLTHKYSNDVIACQWQQLIENAL